MHQSVKKAVKGTVLTGRIKLGCLIMLVLFLGMLGTMSLADGIKIVCGPNGYPNPALSEKPVYCNVFAMDSLDRHLSFIWSSPNGGTFSNPSAPNTMWKSPANVSDTTDTYTISVEISDHFGNTTTVSYDQGVIAIPPMPAISIIRPASGNPNPVFPNDPVRVTVFARGTSATPLAYSWSADSGSFSNATVPCTEWIAPENSSLNIESYNLSVIITDGYSFVTSACTQSVLCSVMQNSTEFTAADDTAYWRFQPAGSCRSTPQISWLESYADQSGVIKITFTGPDQGYKITSRYRFRPEMDAWYKLSINFYCDETCDKEEIVPLFLLYNHNTSYNIKQLSGAYTGNGLIKAGNWYTIEAFILAAETTGDFQIIIKNNGNLGAMYLNSIVMNQTVPPAIANPVPVAVPGGAFDTDADTTNFGFQITQSAFTTIPAISWETSYNGQDGVVGLTFTKPNQGIKITSASLLEAPAGRNVVMTFKIRPAVANDFGLQVLGWLYGEEPVKRRFDMNGCGYIGTIPADQWTTIYVPLTSVSEQSVYRVQIGLKNCWRYPQTIYLDDIQFFYAADSSATPVQLAMLPMDSTKGSWFNLYE